MILCTLWIEAISFSESKIKTTVTLNVTNLVLLVMFIETNRTSLAKQCHYTVSLHSNINVTAAKILSCL
jgi:hypothetical protein